MRFQKFQILENEMSRGTSQSHFLKCKFFKISAIDCLMVKPYQPEVFQQVKERRSKNKLKPN